MSATSVASTFRADRNFTIAVTALVLLGAAELCTVAYHYATRGRGGQAVAPSVTAVPSPAATAAPLPTAAAPEIATTAQTPVTAPAPPAAEPAADRLIREAIEQRQRGDTTNALAKLQEAVQADSRNATALAELALTYENIHLFNKSNESWRRLQEIGPGAGPLYELADMKLKVGVLPSTALAAPAVPSEAARSDVEGIPEGSTFAITEVTPMGVQDPDAETKLVLRVGIKKRPATVIDSTRVKIQVFFYDLVDNKGPVLTNAEVNYEWVTPNHDWKEANPEVLAVTYLRPRQDSSTSEAAITAAAAAVKPPVPGKKNPTPPPVAETAEGGTRKLLRLYRAGILQ